MTWLRENLFWLIVTFVFAWLHLRMHGGPPPSRHHPER